MQKVLITGALGQLGRALTKTLDKSIYELILADLSDSPDFSGVNLDITDEAAVLKFAEESNPDIIINAAAFTAVDLCETKEDVAYRVNAIGPANLAKAAKRTGAKLVHISTDYVFDGEAKEPYKPYDTPHPVSAYGRTKFAGEEFVKENCEKYFIIRTAWLYGEGKNFVKTMLRLSESNPEIKVVSDQVGCPTSAVQLAKIIARVITTESYGIYHGVCSGVTSWYGFTCEIMKLMGKSTIITPITSDMYPTPTKRPAYSVLDNTSLKELGCEIADWHEAIREYLKGEE